MRKAVYEGSGPIKDLWQRPTGTFTHNNCLVPLCRLGMVVELSVGESALARLRGQFWSAAVVLGGPLQGYDASRALTSFAICFSRVAETGCHRVSLSVLCGGEWRSYEQEWSWKPWYKSHRGPSGCFNKQRRWNKEKGRRQHFVLVRGRRRKWGSVMHRPFPRARDRRGDRLWVVLGC